MIHNVYIRPITMHEQITRPYVAAYVCVDYKGQCILQYSVSKKGVELWNAGKSHDLIKLCDDTADEIIPLIDSGWTVEPNANEDGFQLRRPAVKENK